MRGVPLRIEIGPKDVQKNAVALARRDKPGREGKSFVPQAGLASAVSQLLNDIQAGLLARATAFRDSHIFEPKDYPTEGNCAKWLGILLVVRIGRVRGEGERRDKSHHAMHPDGSGIGKGKCIVCGNDATRKVYFARGY